MKSIIEVEAKGQSMHMNFSIAKSRAAQQKKAIVEVVIQGFVEM